jgi:hypothetical protein
VTDDAHPAIGLVLVEGRLFDLLERTIPRLTIQRFGNSPRFLDGAFARGRATRMKLALDTEKQMDHRRDPELHTYQQRLISLILPPPHGDELISDTGRAWREACGVVKAAKAGVAASRTAE